MFLLTFFCFWNCAFSSRLFSQSVSFANDLYGKQCPVSGKFFHHSGFPTKDDILLYPLDIFDQSKLLEIQKNQNTTTFKTFNCSGLDIWYQTPMIPHQTHICSSYHTCPVMKGNVDASLERMNNYIQKDSTSYENYSSLCYIHQQLLNKDSKVNIYVFGGSVTKGHYADGCTIDENTPREFCTWLQFLGKWFKSTYPADIMLYDLAIPGEDCALMSEDFQHTVMQNKIESFSSNDIVFLDHSTNDAQIRQTPYEILAFKRGVEKLLFKIFRHSEPGSFPTVVLLGANPVSKMYGKYIDTYQEVAQQYRIMLWSYSDVVMSKFMKVVQSDYIQMLNYDKIYGVHPPWFVHLFQADLYANILEKIFGECDAQQKLQPTLSHSQKTNNRTMDSLPTPLFSTLSNLHDSHQTCRLSLISVSYDEIIHKRDTLLGAWKSYPKEAWQVRLDRPEHPDRGGIIRELDNSQLQQKNLKAKLTITMDFKQSTASIQQSKTSTENLFIVFTIKYLRTYMNAGVAELYVCGEKVQAHKDEPDMDSLWLDWDSYHYSLPFIVTKVIPYTQCSLLPEQRRTVEIVHINKDEGPESPRLNQKFKLISVNVCVQ